MSAGAEDRTDLRRLVREVLREVLPPDVSGRAESPAAGRTVDVRQVRVDDDGDLAALVTQILNLAEDPVRAQDLRAGRVRFTLEPREPSSTELTGQPIEVERGAVTERLIQRAAREQRSLRLGAKAVVTPLARDRARALGVTIDRRDTP